ncbi:hypothetical protein SNEBB_006420 [Seison nebaliae]|nr:hypothetical protein SNEBB_006420 [Seison nebaliae]
MIPRFVFGLTFMQIIRSSFQITILFYILPSIIISSILWIIVNGLMNKQKNHSEDVEWAFLFDLQLNAILPICIIVMLYHVLLFQLVTYYFYSVVSCILTNSLWLLSSHYYFVHLFFGFNTIYHSNKAKVLLGPLIACYLFFFITSIFQLNISEYVISQFFHHNKTI